MSWWGIDVAGYLLTRAESLGVLSPERIEVEHVRRFIRTSEMPWCPGSSRLDNEDWRALTSQTTGEDAVVWALELAASELTLSDDASVLIAASRRLPLSTFGAFGYDKLADEPTVAGECGDCHLHQGAALALDVILEHVASAAKTLGGWSSRSNALFRDAEGAEFHPAPLLLALRAVLENKFTDQIRNLTLRASAFDAEAWDELNEELEFESERQPLGANLAEEKRSWRVSWSTKRLVDYLRLEGILYSSLASFPPGLDSFVLTFEAMSSLRRGVFDKREYFRDAILSHRRHTPGLTALELRLGTPALGQAAMDTATIANELRDALAGYSAANGTDDQPISITFPLGLVKTTPPDGGVSGAWRYDLRAACGTANSLVDLVRSAPDVARFIDGLDVCGSESDMPNWLFGPLYSFVYRHFHEVHPQAAARFHAGEWSWSGLHGLRRIAEVLSFSLPTGTRLRIGHGLAIGRSDGAQTHEMPTDELVDDLVWASIALRSCGAPPSLRRTVERWYFELGSRIGLRFDTREIAERTYVERSNPVVLDQIGFMRVTTDYVEFIGSEPGAQSNDVTANISGILAGAILRQPIHEVLEGADLAAVMATVSDAYDELRGVVAADLKWRSAVVEICPTSNLFAGGVRGIHRHPVKHMLEDGLLIAIGSDDPSIFNTWLGDEMNRLAAIAGLDPSTIGRIAQLSAELVLPGVHRSEIPALLHAAQLSLE